MLCPLLPGVSNTPAQLETLVGFLEECGVEEVFAEAVNQRGSGLKDTEEVLRQAGFISAAEALAAIRRADRWSVYVADQLRDLQAALRNHGMIDNLRFLLYSSKLQPAERARIEADAAGVVWL
jgi:hypothetical protein